MSLTHFPALYMKNVLKEIWINEISKTLWTGLTTIGKGIVCNKSHSVYLKKLWEKFETQQSTHIPTDQ